MQTLIILSHVFICAFLIVLVLMQHGKGADMGAAFGSGGANTMFGSAGSLPFMMKLTGIIAALFFVTSLSLTYLVAHKASVQKANGISRVAVPSPVSEKPAPEKKTPVTPGG